MIKLFTVLSLPQKYTMTCKQQSHESDETDLNVSMKLKHVAIIMNFTIWKPSVVAILVLAHPNKY